MSIQDSPDWSNTTLNQGLPGQWSQGPNDGLEGDAPSATETAMILAGGVVYIWGIDVWNPPGGGAVDTEFLIYSGSSPSIAGGYLKVGEMVSFNIRGFKNTNEAAINIYPNSSLLKWVIRFG